MADKGKGAKHLTELTLGIEGIKEALDEAQKVVEERSKEIGEAANKNIADAFKDAGLGKDSTIIDPKQLEELNKKVDESSEKFKEVAKSVRYVTDSGKEIKKITTAYDELGNRVDKYYKDAGNGLKFYQKKITDDSEKRQREAAKLDAQEEKNFKKSISRLDTLTRKQKEFTSLVERQKTSSVNKQLIADSKEATAAMEKLNDEIRKTGKVSADQANQIDALASKNKQLAGTYEEAGAKGDSFLGKISDKAKWLGAFYIVDGLMKSLGEAIGIIKEAEDASVELQRVLKENLTQGDISRELYDIAGQYGRDFADVQEVALRFSQAGNDWNETLALTKSTMLALNTAELDVEQSTQGLIAITSQWNIEAKDTELLIDKINKTADHFPVTSEKIVTALQRASSSAKNAGLKIEETIGVITALSEATGRSGENIGTALNSLLIYTSKDKALKTFYEVGNDTVKKTVEAYRAGAVSILDVWRALSGNLAELSQEQQAALLKGVNTDELGMHLEEEATEITDDIRKIYGSAGTFRQNYLIALLKNIDTVAKAEEGMLDAAGYSAKENEKYMATLTAAIEKFKAVWKGLVVELGEGAFGIKNTMVFFVKLGTAAGNLIKVMGGLPPILTAVTASVVYLKREKIQSGISSLRSNIVAAKTAVTQFAASIKAAATGQITFKQALEQSGIATTGLATGLSAVLGVISVLQMAYGVVTGIMRRQEEASDAAREKALTAADAQREEAESIYKLADEFIYLNGISQKTAEQQSRMAEISKKLGVDVKSLGEETNGAAKDFDNLAESMRKIEGIDFGTSPAEWEDYIKNLRENVSDAAETEGWFGTRKVDTKFAANLGTVPDEVSDLIENELGDYLWGGTGSLKFAGPDSDEFEKIIPFLEKELELKKELDELSREKPELNVGELDFYSDLTESINKVKDAYVELIQAQIQQEIETEGVPLEAEQYEAFREEILETVGVIDPLKEDMSDFIDNLFPSLAEQAENVGNAATISLETIEDFAAGAEELSDALDDMQKGLDAVYNAYDEFNELGYLNLDTVQALIAAGGDYISCLEFTENGIAINEEAMGKLIDAQRTNALEMIKQAAVSDALKIVQEHLRDETSNVEAASNSLTSSLTGTEAEVANLTVQYLNGAIAANEFARQTAQAANIAAPGKIDRAALESDLKSAVGGYKGFYDYVQKNFTSIEHYSSKASKGMAKDAKAAAKEAKKAGRAAEKAAADATRALKKELNEQKKAVKERYDAEIKEIDKAKKAAQKKYDSAKKALEKEKDAVSDSYDAQKDALEDQKDAIKDYYDAQIDALKDVQKENDRLDKQEEYLKRKREAEKDIAKASVRSGVEWREKEAEAREKLGEVESDRQKELRDQQIEDQIAALEKERDAQMKAIEEQIKGIERAKEAALDAIEARMEALEEQKEKELEALETKKEKLKEQQEAEIKAIEKKIEAADGANKTMASNYQTNFLEPTLASTEEGFNRVFGNVGNSFGGLTQKMSADADSLIAKIGKAGEQIQKSLGSQKLGGPDWKGVTPVSLPPAQKVPAKPNPSTGAYSGGASGRLGDLAKTSPGGTYVTNTNNQMFANIFTDSGAKTLGSKFFTRP